MKSIELFSDENFSIEELSFGTKISGRLAYPGITKNLKFYPIGELLHGHNLNLPVWLNHADIVGTSDIGPDLLPDFYRQKLINKEPIILGSVHTEFKQDTLELIYEAIITDPFYKNPAVLKRMNVSQGVLHPANLKKHCDEVACYKIMRDSIYEEVSLVFHPGFGIATLFLENSISNENYIEKNNSYNLKDIIEKYMTNEKSNEKDCGCSKEVDQASGTMTAAGQCPEGQIFDNTKGTCVPAPDSGNPITNAGGSSPSQVAGEAADPLKKSEEKVTNAQKALESANAELDKARKALEVDEDDKDKKKDDKKDAKKDDKADENIYNGPNADVRQRAKAQEAYNDALDKKYKAIEAVQEANAQFMKSMMVTAKENARGTASISDNTKQSFMKKSIEAALTSPKAWIDQIIKSPENAPWNKTWKLEGDYLDSLANRKFKSTEGLFSEPHYTGYAEHMKSSEATDVAMAGGTDPNNFQRTLSELVLVYPNGIIVTPIGQFCETAILPPGKKEHLFYDVNIPNFSATDEADMDAAGSGYALAPSDIVINASGGKTNAQGGLVRIGFTQLEEIPIDLIQKVNIGFSMRAEQRKNFDALQTAWNNNTAYDPDTDAVRPKGGGNKFATDAQGNTHMVNGNSGAQLTSVDSGATSALTFAGMLAAKKTIVETGLMAENIMTYLPYGGILQVLKDTAITTYLQRSVPEVITEGYIEKISGMQLIASSDCATGDAATVKRAVAFLPTVAFGAVYGRELQVDAERVARQQSVYCTASMKMATFVKRLEATCGISFNPAA